MHSHPIIHMVILQQGDVGHVRFKKITGGSGVYDYNRTKPACQMRDFRWSKRIPPPGARKGFNQ